MKDLNKPPTAAMRAVTLLAILSSAASFHSAVRPAPRVAAAAVHGFSSPARPFLAAVQRPPRISRLTAAAEFAQEVPQEEPVGRLAKMRAAMPPTEELKKSMSRNDATLPILPFACGTE